MKILMLLIIPIIVFIVITGIIWKLIIEYITQTHEEEDKGQLKENKEGKWH